MTTVKGHRPLCPFASTIGLVSLTIARWPLQRGQLRHRGPATYTTQWDATVGFLRPALGCLPAGPGPPKRDASGRGHCAGLDARFHRQLYAEGPYLFADLAATSEAEEQAAIDTDLIKAGGIRYAATRP